MPKSIITHLKRDASWSVSIIPLLLAGILSCYLIFKEYQTLESYNELEHLSVLSVKISALVHEQQKERGRTAGFIGSNGNQFKNELSDQRKLTDLAEADLRNFISEFKEHEYSASLVDKLDAIVNELDNTPNVRKTIDSLSIPLKNAIGHYTNLNTKLLRLVVKMAKFAQDSSVASKIFAYGSFMQGKERAGLERAMGAKGFAQGEFDQKTTNIFKNLIHLQENYFNTFLDYADDTEQNAFDIFKNSPSVAKVSEYRQLALASGNNKSKTTLTPNEWFTAITNKINGMRNLENTLANTLITKVSALQKQATTTLAYWIIALISLMGCTTLLLITTIRNAKRFQAERNKLEKSEQIEEIVRNFDHRSRHMIHSLVDSASAMNQIAGNMQNNANKTTDLSKLVTSAALDTNDNVASVAAATEQLTASIKTIADTTKNSSDNSKNAASVVQNTRKTMQHLSDSTQKIGEVISFITNIAEKTNLLALNATIESARAGTAGKGFAVVANEVKALASQTQSATSEIEAVIAAIQSETNAAVESIEEVHNAINTIREIAETVSESMDQQTEATQTISCNVNQVSQHTDSVTNSIKDVSGAAHDSGEASALVSEKASILQEHSNAMKEEIETFIARIRAI